MTYNDTIEQGATFYRVVTIYSDALNTIPIPLTTKTPRATLMLPSGQHIADFGCAITDSPNGKLAWTMPRAVTSILEANRQYLFNLDIDDSDGITTDRVLSGSITVRVGQVH
jgi:hypothetical protein